MQKVTLTIKLPDNSAIRKPFDIVFAEVYAVVDLTPNSFIAYAVRAFCKESDFPNDRDKRDENYNWLTTEAVNHCSAPLKRQEINIFEIEDHRLLQHSAKYDMEEYLETLKPCSVSISDELFANLTKQASKYDEAIIVFKEAKDRLRNIISNRPTKNSSNRIEAIQLLRYLVRISDDSNVTPKISGLRSDLDELYKRSDINNKIYLNTHTELSNKLMWLNTPIAFYKSPTPYPEQIQ